MNHAIPCASILCAAAWTASASAALTVHLGDGSVATTEATTTFNPSTGGWDVVLHALYAPGGTSLYEVRGTGGETIDSLVIDVPCWESEGHCAPAGSPVVVRVFGAGGQGLRTVHSTVQIGQAETLLSLVDVTEDIGLVEVESIGELEAGRDVIGPVTATTVDNPGRGIVTIDAGRHVLGDIRAPLGAIGLVHAMGRIGASGAPVAIEAKHNVVHVVAFQSCHAEINTRVNGGAGGIYALGTPIFEGMLETASLIANPSTGEPARLRPSTELRGTFIIGGGFSGPGQWMDTALNGLRGQLILNADDLGATWTNPFHVGPEGDPARVTLSGPGYAVTAAALGGGSIGVVPFDLHRSSCMPPSGERVMATGDDPLTVRLRHYGPLVAAAQPAVTVERRPEGSTGGFVTVAPATYTTAIDPTDGNTLIVAPAPAQNPFEAGHEYLVRPVAGALRCDVPSERDVSWTGNYLLTVGTPPCDGDTDGNGQVDIVDLITVLSYWGISTPQTSPADVDGNGVIDITDLLTVLARWGACQ